MNTPAEYARVAEVYAAVFDLPAEARAKRIVELCAGDDTLKQWVEELLAADDALRVSDETRVIPDDLGQRGVDAVFGARRSDRHIAAGTIAAGRYRIVSLVGRGGVGEVYSAEDLLLEQTVALKFLTQTTHAKARAAALLNEVRLARRVRHPNVCQIFDVGEADGERFISMEYVRGANLAEELRRIGRFARPKAVHIAHQICAGLSAIHREGIVHGDLKPANIMLDEQGDVRILDFGISEVRGTLPHLAASEAKSDRLIGTPAYLAPERWQGQGPTVRSDIYALGLLLYEVFSGERAIQADGAQAYRSQHETAVPAQLSSLAADVDGRVESIVERCFAKNAEERPASAIEVACALPGGDVLGSLVLAGVLPTAERVAEGAEEPKPKRAFVAGLLLALFVLFAAAAKLTPYAHLVEASNLPLAPVALEDRAETILDELGYARLPYTAYGFGSFNGEDKMRFWYRGSRGSLEPSAVETSIELTDPPFTESGMVGVVLATTGELRSIISLGPDPSAAIGSDAALRELFHRAGLDFASFTGATPTQERVLQRGRPMAWSAPGWRVEASEENGQWVYFEVVRGDAPLLWGSGQPRTDYRRPVRPFMMMFALAALIVAAVLAQGNLRRGAVDRIGARRTATAVLLLSLAHGVTDIVNTGNAVLHLRYLFFAVGQAVLFASATWVFYAALEPFFRRYWPHGLVSWTRLLRGRFRDPILGRDVLVGLCLGFLAVIFEVLQVWLAQRLEASPLLVPTLEQLRALAGAWGALGAVLTALLGAVVLSWVQCSLLVLLRRLVGAGILLVASFALVVTAGNAVFDPEPWAGLGIELVFWLIATPIFIRFGFTTMVSMAFVFLTMTHLPTTIDPDQWYFSTSVAGYAILLGLGVFAALDAFDLKS